MCIHTYTCVYMKTSIYVLMFVKNTPNYLYVDKGEI